jgi:DNA-binding HxlR family transcriptional regulator
MVYHITRLISGLVGRSKAWKRKSENCSARAMARVVREREEMGRTKRTDGRETEGLRRDYLLNVTPRGQFSHHSIS